jgi:predicted short-subunit dehydrogenase-like oxidoreductase (DUF2520 family)
MKVTIIGSGNVATVIGRKVLGAGCEVLQVAGRKTENVAKLAKELNAEPCVDLQSINDLADIYLIAVNDSGIGSVVQQLKPGNKLVVHTAASISKNILAGCTSRYGVIYPLQSFRKELWEVPKIPVFLDGNNDETKTELEFFASKWADSVHFADDEKRLRLHVSAVMVNNFVNHIFTVTNQFCESEGLDFKELYPLIEETIERIKTNRPSEVQTGPAIRNDFNTLERHISVLSHHHYLKELYRMISSNIIDFYSVESKG